MMIMKIKSTTKTRLTSYRVCLIRQAIDFCKDNGSTTYTNCGILYVELVKTETGFTGVIKKMQENEDDIVVAEFVATK